MKHKNNKLKKYIERTLQHHEIHPVLMDIGASGEFPYIWTDIRTESIYLGFDPDLREIRNNEHDGFYKSTIFNSAVIDEINGDGVLFYLTKSPYCSSTLPPDHKSLSNYLFSDLFSVESSHIMNASNLNNLLMSQDIDHIDWFKTDSQGIDLRIFKSLNDDIRSKVLAVDIEPGLIDVYIGEDLFVDAHTYLTQNGFWLSDLKVCGSSRIKNTTIDRLKKLDVNSDYYVLNEALKESPGWCEARYLRTCEWISQNNYSKDKYILIIIFSLLDNQLGHAFDILFEYERKFGSDEFSKEMLKYLIKQLNRDILIVSPVALLKKVGRTFFPSSVKKWIKKRLD